MNGILVLAGGGEFEPAMEKVDRALLENVAGDAHVAIVPAASGGEPDRAVALAERGAGYFRGLGASADPVPVVDRESAMDESLSRRIAAANVVYLTDGDARYLHKTLNYTYAWVAIGNVIELNGIVAASGQAASVFGDRIPSAPLLWRAAFNIFPGVVIVPDYEEASAFRLRLRRWTRFGKFSYLGIDRHTALFNENFQFTVVGQGGVTVWSSRRHEKRDDGDPLVWP